MLSSSNLKEGKIYYYYVLKFGYGYNFNICDKAPITECIAHCDNGYWKLLDPKTKKVLANFNMVYYRGGITETYEEAVEEWNSILKKEMTKLERFRKRAETNIKSCFIPDSLPF